MNFHIRDAVKDDVPNLLALHNWSIENLDYIWIEQLETMDDRLKWFEERVEGNCPVLVVEDTAGKMVGYAAYGTYRGRDGYDLTVEHSVYLYPQARGHGLGHILLDRLIEIATARGKHVMVAIIDTANELSIGLHLKHGFEMGGHVPQAGKKNGVWRDQTTLYKILDAREKP